MTARKKGRAERIEKDIELIILNAGVSRKRAASAYYTNNGDVIAAIIQLIND